MLASNVVASLTSTGGHRGVNLAVPPSKGAATRPRLQSLAARRNAPISRWPHAAAGTGAVASKAEAAAQALPLPPDGHFSWSKQWYAVAIAESMDASRPTPVQLLGKSLVLWRDGTGGWRCFEDRCPHRAAPLSEGKVWPDGTLMCSYHGWRFDGSGTCVKIPQAASQQAEQVACASQRACAASHPVKEAQGLIFVWGEAGAQAAAQSEGAALPIDELRAAAEARGEQPATTLRPYLRDVPYDYSTLVENLTDPAHVPFAHHMVQGSRDWVRYGDSEMKLVEEAGRLSAECATGPFGPGPMRLTFHPPGLAQQWVVRPDGTYFSANLHMTPTTPGRARAIITGSTTSKPRSLSLGLLLAMLRPVWWRHFTLNATLDGDTPFLHIQEHAVVARAAEDGKGWRRAYFLPTSADALVAAFRNWLEGTGGGGPYGPLHKAPGYPALVTDHRVLLNRYEQHTKHCAQCMAALKQAERLRTVAAAATSVAWGSALVVALQWVQARAAAGAAAALPVLPLAATVGAGTLLALAWQALGGLVQRFYFVDYDHASRA